MKFNFFWGLGIGPIPISNVEYDPNPDLKISKIVNNKNKLILNIKYNQKIVKI